MSDLFDCHCKHCGQQARRLVLLALMEDCGAKVYPSATHCWANQEHDFVPNESREEKAVQS